MFSPWLLSSDLTGNCNFTPVIAAKRCFLDSSPYAIHLVFSWVTAAGPAVGSVRDDIGHGGPTRVSQPGGTGQRRACGSLATTRQLRLPRMPPPPAVLELTRPRPVPRGLLLYNIHDLSFFVHGRLPLCSWPQLPLLLPCPNCRGYLGKWVPGVGPAGSYHGQPPKEAAQDVEAVRVRSSVAWEFIDMTEQEEDLIYRMYRLVGDRWDLIAGRIPGRKPEEIERFWIMRHGEGFTAKRHGGYS
ncbi:chloroplast unusual positioning protein [Musa troglodytarum]|uniref:Chloroplast unusual positioning protein n=1 Tax=Musa troglodytarum TaxID=320322 RepID=A0A9E7I5K3_9LILI|nr:chloroplast unusual positioning protein [Musa troglodytarum]